MRRSDRATLRKIQSILTDRRRPDRDARGLALIEVSTLLLKIEGRRLLAELRADRKDA